MKGSDDSMPYWDDEEQSRPKNIMSPLLFLEEE